MLIQSLTSKSPPAPTRRRSAAQSLMPIACFSVSHRVGRCCYKPKKLPRIPTIDIFNSILPKRGKYIADGKYGFGIVDGSPAMRCRWIGRFSRTDQIFHFQTQTEKFALLDTKSMITQCKVGPRDIVLRQDVGPAAVASSSRNAVKSALFGRFSGTSLRDCRRRMIERRIFVNKIERRGRPRIRTAEYWREYYTRKQREWRAAHPRKQSSSRAKEPKR